VVKSFVDTILFGTLAIITFFVALWFKDYSFQNGYFAVKSPLLGWDGLIVWLCLMMPLRLVHKYIMDKLYGMAASLKSE